MYQFDDEDKGFLIPHPPLTNQHNNTIINPSEYGLISSNSNKFLSNLQLSYNLPLHDLTSLNPTFDTSSPSPNTSIINPIISPSSSSEDHPSLLFSKEQIEEQDLRRQKRMLSNRESARRSRLRKRKQLENLQAQVMQLLSANHQLAEKLNLVMDSNYEILQENTRLREEVIVLRNELLMSSMKSDFQEEVDNGACVHDIRANNNNTQTMLSTSPNSVTSSMDVLPKLE